MNVVHALGAHDEAGFTWWISPPEVYSFEVQQRTNLRIFEHQNPMAGGPFMGVHEFLCAGMNQAPIGPWGWSWLFNEITCPLCRVKIDQLLERGEFYVKPDGTYYWPDEPEYESIAHFVDFLREEERTTYTTEELQKLAKNMRLSTGKIRAALAGSKILLEERPREKMEYQFRAGGTFGFPGLKR